MNGHAARKQGLNQVQQLPLATPDLGWQNVVVQNGTSWKRHLRPMGDPNLHELTKWSTLQNISSGLAAKVMKPKTLMGCTHWEHCPMPSEALLGLA
jgi:hypothetical protein